MDYEKIFTPIIKAVYFIGLRDDDAWSERLFD